MSEENRTGKGLRYLSCIFVCVLIIGIGIPSSIHYSFYADNVPAQEKAVYAAIKNLGDVNKGDLSDYEIKIKKDGALWLVQFGPNDMNKVIRMWVNNSFDIVRQEKP